MQIYRRLSSLNDIYELWRDLKRGIKNNTFENYKYMYETFVRNQIGSQFIMSIKKTDIKRYYNSLVDERHLKPATIDSIHTVLHQVFEMAVDDDYIRSNPTDNVLRELKKSHCFRTEKRRALTKPEQELFLNYESKAAGKQYLAEIRIPEKDISTGKSSNGTVYLTVYKDNIVRFDEVNCSALYCLPVADVQLTASDIPKQISIKGYDGSVESVIKITDVQYSYDKSVTPILNIVISGEKVSGSNSNYDMISYKLYDSFGYLVDSGNICLRSLSKGDKFKDDSVSFYDAVPGETYNIVLSEYSW